MISLILRFICVCALIALTCPFLSAQGAGAGVVQNLTGSFNTNDDRIIRIDIDYGGSPQSADVDVTVDSLAGPGFDLELYDWQGYVDGLSGSRKAAQVMAAGSNGAQLTTPSRTGVHPIVLVLKNHFELGVQSDYSGVLLMTGATVVGVTESDSLYADYSDPWRFTYGDLAAGFVTYNPGKNVLGTIVRIDMGAGLQDQTFRFDCSGAGVAGMVVSWPDGTGARRQLNVNADSNGDILFYPPASIRRFTIPAQRGVVDVTVSVEKAAGFSHADWLIYAPGDARITSMEAPQGGGGNSGGESCSTSEGGLPLPAAALCLAGVALLRRRRPIS
ncbi:MAG: hypothetical protein R3E76_07355 [Planctomycetota bacterium]